MLVSLIEVLISGRFLVRASTTLLGNHQTMMQSRSLYLLKRRKPPILHVPPVTNAFVGSAIRSY